MVQLDLAGRTKEQLAIQRIQEFAPDDGYYLAFSGGKDSVVVHHLTVRAGVPFDAHYHVVGVDPPELVTFIKTQFAEVARDRPPKTMFALVMTNGAPTRLHRWCCRELKELGGEYRTILTGIRWGESTRRKRRRMVEHCLYGSWRRFVNPIIDWSTSEVWAYIRGKNLPYCSLYDEGFKRLGCVLCPMKPPRQRREEMTRWPKLSEAWRRAIRRSWERQTPGMQRFATFDAYWDWWMGSTARVDERQGYFV